MKSSGFFGLAWVLVLGLPGAQAANSVVYKCPGPPVLYTDAMTPGEAKQRNCAPVEGNPITVIQSPRPRPAPGAAGGADASRGASAPADSRVSAGDQKARDSDARRILEQELARSQGRLEALQKEYNGGQPERLGNEANYQKYLDRVADLKASILRTEADVAAIKRELAKLPL